MQLGRWFKRGVKVPGDVELREAIRWGTETLSAAGIESARVDAELMLCHAMKISRKLLMLESVVPGAAYERYEIAINQRASRIPLQHITGRAPFRYLEVEVGPGVLTPRPETELLVDATIKFVKGERESDASFSPIIVDLCSGSAAMSISLATEIEQSRVVALELIPKAFGWGKKNVDAHLEMIRSAGSSVTLVKGDVRGCERRLLKSYRGETDVVVSNPPYIPNWAVPRDPEVIKHEPIEALFGGEDGLLFVDAVVQAAVALLRPGGLLIIEHADLQGEDGEASVPRFVREYGGFINVEDHLDLAGRPRYTTAIKA